MKIVELNSGATDYNAGDSGTGTGALNSFTIAPAKWKVGQWATPVNYRLIDANGTSFLITANTTTVLTVSGTPATGAYKILPQLHLTGFVGGTSLLLEVEKIDVDWANAILNIQKPVSKTTQITPLNNGNSYTYDQASGIVTDTTTTFDTSLKAGDRIYLNGIEHTFMQAPSGNLALINKMPVPDASGTMVCYKVQKDYGVNLKKISHNVSVDGWLVNDYVHHSDWTTKRYAEEKAKDLYTIVGADGGNMDFANLAFRENAYLEDKYIKYVKADSGTGVGSASTMTDSKKSWTVNEWVGYTLSDSNKVLFAITANTATALTVTLNGGAGTPASGAYKIFSAVNGCMACTRMKISDNTKVSAPIRGGDGTTQHVDKLLVSLSFRYIDAKV